MIEIYFNNFLFTVKLFYIKLIIKIKFSLLEAWNTVKKLIAILKSNYESKKKFFREIGILFKFARVRLFFPQTQQLMRYQALHFEESSIIMKVCRICSENNFVCTEKIPSKRYTDDDQLAKISLLDVFEPTTNCKLIL